MALRQQIVHKQSQRLIMTQELRQSIELLAMSNVDLLERIQSELIENPLIEEGQEKQEPISGIEKQRENTVQDKYTENLSEWQVDGGLPKESDFSNNQEKTESKHQFLENTICATESLQDHLGSQLSLLNIDSESFQCGIEIISALNNQGFLISDLKELFRNDHSRLLKANEVIMQIQKLDPIGCATSGIVHTLLVQSYCLYPENLMLHLILKEDFDLIERLDYEKIAHKRKLDIEVVESLIQKIKTLEPYPGSTYAPPQSNYIVAEVSVVEHGGVFKVILNNDLLPHVILNKDYETFQNKDSSQNDLEYFQNKMAAAQSLINGLKQRESTLYHAMKSIVKFQKDFFLHGSEALKPLTLKAVANDIEMHESTISRITSNKYVQTKWGLFELKYFFSNSIGGTLGKDSYSSTSIQSKIKKMIDEENADDLVSDQMIVEKLQDIGVKIARRTVAKYRNNLKILPVDRRRKIKKLR